MRLILGCVLFVVAETIAYYHTKTGCLWIAIGMLVGVLIYTGENEFWRTRRER